MTTTFIHSPEDMNWLFDTHIGNDLMISWKPRSAMLFGNEDCPDEIHLWPAYEPSMSETPLIGKRLGDSYSFCGPLQREEAMKIDAQERIREANVPTICKMCDANPIYTEGLCESCYSHKESCQ